MRAPAKARAVQKWTAISVWACLGACATPPDPAPLVGRADRVLMVGYNKPSLVKEVTEALQASAPAHQLPAVVRHIDIVDRKDIHPALDRLGASLSEYDAIFTDTMTTARAVQLKLPNKPIVFTGVDDPLQSCLVDGLQHPGRNATGYMHYLRDDDFKMLQTMRSAFPGLRDVMMLVDHENYGATTCDENDSHWTADDPEPCKPGERSLDDYLQRRVFATELDQFAKTLGLRLRFAVVCTPSDLQSIASWGSQQKSAGWHVPWHGNFHIRQKAVVEALNGTQQPAIYPHHGYSALGGLISLSPTSETGSDQEAIQALIRVLRGESPANLPVQVPRGFTLHVNAHTAAALQQRPALQVLRVADRIIH